MTTKVQLQKKKKKNSGHELQGGRRQDKLIGGKLPDIK
jgi:hypothetical protein